MEGLYKPGEALPTIRSLAETFDVSTKTVQKAVRALSEEGIIETKRGKGLFVKSVSRGARNSRKVLLAAPYDDGSLKRNSNYPGQVAAALKKSLGAAGYSLVTCNLLEMEELTVVKQISVLEVAGIVLLEVYSERLVTAIRELGLPVVSMDYDTHRLGMPCVVFDNVWGGFQATRFLLEQGHREITALHPQYVKRVGGNPFLDPVEEDRMEGYRIAMKDAGLAARVEEYPSGNEALRSKLLELFGQRPAPTAIICKGDHYALSVIRELVTMGFEIPGDVSFVGFGGTGLEFSPGRKITSVWVDCEGMGRNAAEMLLSEMQGGEGRPERRVLPVEITIHDSVAPIAQAVSPGVTPKSR